MRSEEYVAEILKHFRKVFPSSEVKYDGFSHYIEFIHESDVYGVRLVESQVDICNSCEYPAKDFTLNLLVESLKSIVNNGD